MHLHVARLVASSFSLVAFAVAVLVGLRTGNPADAILLRAVVSMVIAAVAGWTVGLVIEHVVRTHMRKIDAMADRTISDEEALAAAATVDPSGAAEVIEARAESDESTSS